MPAFGGVFEGWGTLVLSMGDVDCEAVSEIIEGTISKGIT